MSFTLTSQALAVSKQNEKTPQIILDIDGIPIIFGTDQVSYMWSFDEGYFFDDGLRFDTPTHDPNSRAYISLDKTTKNITQQITPDKSGTSSVSSVTIELVDKNQEVTRLFQNGNYVNDILSRDATVYMTFAGLSHPEDSVPVFRGYIDDYTIGAGNITISVAHPENKKRSDLFPEFTANLVNPIDENAQTITVTSTDGLIVTSDALNTYLKIDDEYMFVDSVDDVTFEIGVQRGQLGTTSVSHTTEPDINNMYRLTGDPIDLILKIYMSSSNGPTWYFPTQVKSINQIDTQTFVQNAINFGDYNIQSELGLVVGDFVYIENSLEAANNNIVLEIESFGQQDNNFYIVVTDINTLVTVTEESEDCTCSSRSKYNILGEGLGLTTREIDVQGHIDVQNNNPNTLPSLDFFIQEEIDGKSFVDEQLMFPVALYSIPRKARISLKIVQPPLSVDESLTLDETTVVNIEKLSSKRSVNKYLYNTIVYKYDKTYDLEENKYLRGKIFQNESSFNRITAGRKQLKIISDGLRDTGDTSNLLDRQAEKLFERYQFAAQRIDGVEVLYGDGYNLEVGDIVVFGGENVQISDLNTGERVFLPRLMEVVNKSLNFVNGNVKLNLLESNYGLNVRYGVISPSSIVGVGSTTNSVIVTKSFDVGEYDTETDKWQQFVNQRVRVFSPDYTRDGVSTILQINPSNKADILLKDDLSFTPQEGDIVEVPTYDDVSARIDSKYKDFFCFQNAQAKVTEQISVSQFRTDRPEVFYVGSQIYIHSEDYNYDTFTEIARVAEIDGDLITLETDLILPPSVGDLVESNNYGDGGSPYAIV